MTNTKPSKKTEWEKEFENELNYYFGCDVINPKFATHKIIDAIHSLLHQRDNEIREKIRGMKKNTYKYQGIAKVSADFSQFGGKKFNVGDVNEFESTLEDTELAYNQALDDLLTYLSNRNNE